jgi:hypothetical protein
MRAVDPAPSAKKTPPSGYVWGLLAALTCPCHLPLLAVLLAGTAGGAIVSEHLYLIVVDSRPDGGGLVRGLMSRILLERQLVIAQDAAAPHRVERSDVG